MKRITKMLVVFLLGMLMVQAALGQIFSEFEQRAKFKLRGDFTYAGNTALIFDPYADNGDNAEKYMAYVDVDGMVDKDGDGNDDTYNSSSADLVFHKKDGSNENGALPECTVVRFARLYWSGWADRLSVNDVDAQGDTIYRNKILFRKEGEEYTELTATVDDFIKQKKHFFTASVDVTDYVKEHRDGTYTVANLPVKEARNDWRAAGAWNLVVVYENERMDMRSVYVYDGFVQITGGQSLPITLSGFRAPPSGAVELKMGIFTLEGDYKAKGDQFQIRNRLTNAYESVRHGNNVVNNFFNSSVYIDGDRNPAYKNNGGIDVATWLAQKKIDSDAEKKYVGNSDTSLDVNFTTRRDYYSPVNMSMSVSEYYPEIHGVNKIVSNGGLAVAPNEPFYTITPGSEMKFEMDLYNKGNEKLLKGDMYIPLPALVKNITFDNGLPTNGYPQLEYVPGPTKIPAHPDYTAGLTTNPGLAEKDAPYGYIIWKFYEKELTPADNHHGGNFDGLSSTAKYTIHVRDDCFFQRNYLTCYGGYDDFKLEGYIRGKGQISTQYSIQQSIRDYQLRAGECGPLAVRKPQFLRFEPNEKCGKKEGTPIMQTVCANNDTKEIRANIYEGTIGADNVHYKWTNDNTSIGLAASSTATETDGIIPSFTIPNNADGTAHIVVTAMNERDCEGTTVTYTIKVDHDCDGVPDDEDPDDDNDGIPDTEEGGCSVGDTNCTPRDTDGDGTPDKFDDDSDGDGCPDYKEAGFTEGNVHNINGNGAVASTPKPGYNPADAFDQNKNTACQWDVEVLKFINGKKEIYKDEGETFVYKIQAKNTRDELATDVVIKDVLPTGVTFVQVIEGSNYDSATGKWAVGNIAEGEVKVLQLLCRVADGASAEPQAMKNTATYTPEPNTDTNNTNNTSDANLQVCKLEMVGTPVNTICGNNQGKATLKASQDGRITVKDGISKNVTANQEVTFSNLVAGHYNAFFEKFDAENNVICESNVEFDIYNDTGDLKVEITTLEDVKCNGEATGKIVLTATGTTSTYTYTLDGEVQTETSNTFTKSDLTVGEHEMLVKDANGCEYRVSFEIDEPEPLFIEESSVTNAKCNGDMNGKLIVNGAGGTPPYQYSKDDGATWQSSNIFSNLGSATYKIFIKDANDCEKKLIPDPVISEPDELTVTLTPNTPLCSDSPKEIEATVTGGTAPYSYLWSNGSTNKKAKDLEAGIAYKVVVTDVNDCEVTSLEHTFTALTTPELTANVIEDAVCATKGKVEITSNMEGTVTVNGEDKGISANGTVTFELTDGYYTANFVSADGCEAETSFNIQREITNIMIDSSFEPIKCKGGQTTVTVEVTSPQTGTYTYILNKGTTEVAQNTTGTFSNVEAGRYTVVVKNENECSTSQLVTVSEPSALNFDYILTNLKCNANGAGKIQVISARGGSGNYEYKLQQSGVDIVAYQTNATFENLDAGDYTIVMHDTDADADCFFTQDVTLTEPTEIDITEGESIDPSCADTADGEITISLSGGVEPYQFAWTSETGDYHSSEQNAMGLKAGVQYKVVVIDANGCTKVFEPDKLTKPQEVELTATPTNALCNKTNGSVEIGSDMEGTVKLVGVTSKNIAANGTVSFENLAAGHYEVIFTQTETGCEKAIEFDVQNGDSDFKLVSLDVTALTCYGKRDGKVAVVVSGGTPDANGKYTYTLDGTAEQETANYTKENLTPGVHILQIKDSSDCSISINFTIEEPEELRAVIANKKDILCKDDNSGEISVRAEGGVPPYQYAWSKDGMVLSDKTTATVTGLTGGTYSVVVTDARGENCPVTLDVTIEEPETLTATLTVQDIFCNGEASGEATVIVTGGTRPYFYDWSTGSTDRRITNLEMGEYTVNVTDANGCTVEEINFTIEEPNVISLEMGTITPTQCSAIAGAAEFIADQAGDISLNYENREVSLQDDGSGQFKGVIDDLPAGYYEATLRVNSGCEEKITFNIRNEKDNLFAKVTNHQDITCFGEADGAIMVRGEGGTGSLTYSLNGATPQDNGTFENLSKGEYSVLVKDENDCRYTVSFDIDEPTKLGLQLSSKHDISNSNVADGFIFVSGTGGTTPYVYSLVTKPAGVSETIISNRIDNLKAGKYLVKVEDANGCTATMTVSLGEQGELLSIIEESITQPTCHGSADGAIDITVTGGVEPYTYFWSNGLNTEDLKDIPAGTYSVKVTDKNGKVANKTFTTLINPEPVTLIQIGDVVDGTVTLQASEAGTISLDGVDKGAVDTNFQITLTELKTGLHNATFTSEKGCTAIYTFSVSSVNCALYATLEYEDVLCNGGTTDVTVKVTGNVGSITYNLSGTSVLAQTDNNVFTGLSKGHYELRVADEAGCFYTVDFDVDEPDELGVEVINLNTDECTGSDKAIAIVSGGTKPYTYEWKDNAGNTIGQNSMQASGLSEGSYYVSIVDANGCKVDSKKVDIASNKSKLEVSNITNTTCNANTGSVVITSSNGSAVSLNGVTQASGSTFTGLYAGYYIAYTDDDCPVSVGFNIRNLNSTLTASLETEDISCFGADNGKITIIPNGGTAFEDGTFEFVLDNGDVERAATYVKESVAKGNHIVRISDANGCNYSLGFDIDEPNELTLYAISINNASCNGGADGAVIAFANGGTTPYKFSIDGADFVESKGFIEGVKAGKHTIVVKDANGCTSGEASVLVEEDVCKPELIDDNRMTNKGESVSDNVLTNDSSQSGKPLEVTQFEIDGVAYPAGETVKIDRVGTFVLKSDGNYTFTPDKNFYGTMPEVIYTATDGITEDTAELTIEVIRGNDAPIATDNNYTVVEEVPITADVALDDEPDTWSKDGGNIWTIETEPAHGDVVMGADGKFMYTPDKDYVGEDSFVYKVCDADGDCSTATVSLNVGVYPIDAVDDIVEEDGILSDSSTVDIYNNDTLNGQKFDPEDVILTEIENYTYGVLTLNLDGTVDVAPDTPAGIYELKYEICDKAKPSLCDEAVVVIKIGCEGVDTDIVVPQLVTPNNDTKNDYWVISKLRSLHFVCDLDTKVMLFNRWGAKVWEQENYMTDEGNLFEGYSQNSLDFEDGTLLPAGAYFYVIEIDGEVRKKGYIYILYNSEM